MASAPKITVHPSGSLVTFTYSGSITAAVIQANCDEVRALASSVQPGFTILADLSDLERMDPDCVPLLSLIMDQMNKLGVARVVRVIPDPKKDIGLAILSLFHYRSGIKISTVPTRAEADRLVGNAPRQPA
jgi:ABC-type transporter Mla MlaB component